MTIYNKFIEATNKALWDSDLIANRVILAMSEFFWSIMLIWAGDTFNRPTYHYMAVIMPEFMWGIVFFISAILQTYIVVSGNLHTKCARYFALWNMSLWIYVVVSMLFSVYPPPAAIGGEIAVAISACWIWVRPHILIAGYKRASIG